MIKLIGKHIYPEASSGVSYYILDVDGTEYIYALDYISNTTCLYSIYDDQIVDDTQLHCVFYWIILS